MKKLLLAAVILLLAAVGGYAGFRYRRDVYLPEKQLEKDTGNFESLVERIRPEIPAEDAPAVLTENPIAEAEQISDNTVAWLRIPGTRIDFPVAQAEDNEYYLNHSLDGSENRLGCPFLDCRCLRDLSGYNSIIYGHHFTRMRMFAEIYSFKEQSFLEAHPTGYLITETEVIPIRFFAYLNVRNTSPVYHAVFLTEEEKRSYLDTLFDEALYTVAYQKEDLTDARFVLLSTCSYEFEDARGVLAGVILPAEKTES